MLIKRNFKIFQKENTRRKGNACFFFKKQRDKRRMREKKKGQKRKQQMSIQTDKHGTRRKILVLHKCGA